MPNTAIKPHGVIEDDAIPAHGIPRETLGSDLRGQLHIVQNSTEDLLPAPQSETGRRSTVGNAPGDLQPRVPRLVSHSPGHEGLMNARQVAEKLGVSERFIRDHTTRRSPRIPGVKLGKLLRYRAADVETFMEALNTQPSSRRP